MMLRYCILLLCALSASANSEVVGQSVPSSAPDAPTYVPVPAGVSVPAPAPVDRTGDTPTLRSTGPVYFYVQRNTSFTSNEAVLPFELEQLNVGGAMNLTSGIFTAPVNGIYHFAFSGLKNDLGNIYIHLRVNNKLIGMTYSGRHNTHVTISLQSTLRLQTGDRVNLSTAFNDGGCLHDNSGHFTHFSGSLLAEEI